MIPLGREARQQAEQFAGAARPISAAIRACLPITAPWMVQHIPPCPLPGYVGVILVTNIPRRRVGVPVYPVRLPVTDYGHTEVST